MQGRWTSDAAPWDYRTLVLERLKSAKSVLDLGTGGGEFLSSLLPLPQETYATEGYAPNLRIARLRLEPLGVRVIPIQSDNRIDLPTGSVDLVLSRHEEFDAKEVYRMLPPGGIFLTQQVGARNSEEINQRLGAASGPATNAVGSALELATEISSAGFRILAQEDARYQGRFFDVGALIWYLRFAPWQIPRFSVSRYREALKGIHDEIESTGAFRVTEHRLIVSARRAQFPESPRSLGLR